MEVSGRRDHTVPFFFVSNTYFWQYRLTTVLDPLSQNTGITSWFVMLCSAHHHQTLLYLSVGEGLLSIPPSTVEGGWNASEHYLRTLLYCSVEEGLLRIPPSTVEAGWDASEHYLPTLLYCSVEEGLTCIPPPTVEGMVGCKSRHVVGASSTVEGRLGCR